jgi:hypothetical protein
MMHRIINDNRSSGNVEPARREVAHDGLAAFTGRAGGGQTVAGGARTRNEHFHMIVETDAGKAIYVGRGEVDPAHPRVEVFDPRDGQGAATKFVSEPADLVAHADTFAAVFHTIVSAIAGSVGGLGDI